MMTDTNTKIDNDVIIDETLELLDYLLAKARENLLSLKFSEATFHKVSKSADPSISSTALEAGKISMAIKAAEIDHAEKYTIYKESKKELDRVIKKFD